MMGCVDTRWDVPDERKFIASCSEGNGKLLRRGGERESWATRNESLFTSIRDCTVTFKSILPHSHKLNGDFHNPKVRITRKEQSLEIT